MSAVFSDIGLLRGLGTLLVFSAFIGVLFWTYRQSADAFSQAAALPLADEPQPLTAPSASRSII